MRFTSDAAGSRAKRRAISLKARLLALAALVMLAGLSVFAWQLSGMFRQHVERSARADLELYLEQLIVALRRQPDGRFATSALLPDPRFMRPLSGFYWQVQDADGHLLARSRSLWDASLKLPGVPLPRTGALWFRSSGPGGSDERLIVLARRILVPRQLLQANAAASAHGGEDQPEIPLVFIVGRETAQLEQAVAAFRRDMGVSLLLLAVVLLAALLAQVWLGLRPLTALRRQIADIRKGRRQQLELPAVAEIDATVEELNKLLRQQRRHMEQARARAANLAHGLKTPLAALGALARDLHEDGQEEKARAVLHQVALLGRQVQHELSRARVRGGGIEARSPLHPALQKLLRTLRTLHGEEHPQWRLEVARGLSVNMAEGDLLELLGNLLDNAAKWARAEVRVGAVEVDGGAWVEVVVEDDGPGVPPEKRADILKRGVRLDEQVPGSGLGLAIVQEIVNAYGGELALDEGVNGGLKVTVRLPAGQARDSSPDNGQAP